MAAEVRVCTKEYLYGYKFSSLVNILYMVEVDIAVLTATLRTLNKLPEELASSRILWICSTFLSSTKGRPDCFTFATLPVLVNFFINVNCIITWIVFLIFDFLHITKFSDCCGNWLVVFIEILNHQYFIFNRILIHYWFKI